jgi:tetratricopeptide (TPR) repeat protein
VKKALFILAVLALSAVAVALAYQAAARERDYRAQLTNGDTALRDDQTFGAIEAYSGAIALRPDSTLAHLRRGETYRRLSDFDAAARDLRAAADLDPSATRSTGDSGSSTPPTSTRSACGWTNVPASSPTSSHLLDTETETSTERSRRSRRPSTSTISFRTRTTCSASVSARRAVPLKLSTPSNGRWRCLLA